MVKIGDAVASGMVANETLGYFLARIYGFLIKIGVDKDRLRFRQHMGNEMAHYACDCWDAELLTSYGWVECVGCADRSAFDLTQHTKVTGVKLCAEKKLPEPVIKQITEIVPNKAPIGKAFKKDAKAITDALAKLSVEDIIPSVIEPSFGIGRVMYALFEHNFRVREEDEQRTYFTLPPVIAPLKCSVLPLSNNVEFSPLVAKVSEELTENDVSHKVDDSAGSIGKRYARTDEVAVPFGITIDFESLKEPHSVTLRERDTTSQVRIEVDKVGEVLRKLSIGRLTWDQVTQQFPKFESQ